MGCAAPNYSLDNKTVAGGKLFSNSTNPLNMTPKNISITGALNVTKPVKPVVNTTKKPAVQTNPNMTRKPPYVPLNKTNITK